MRNELQTLLKQYSALTLLAVASVVIGQPASANPQGGDVVAGTATITTPEPSTLQIDQSTNRAIINWDSFNIDAGETTRFALPNSDSWTLNRVVGSQSPSLIFGSLESNGNVVIVNPDGMHFGAGSTVDVNRLIATTADITNDDFMAGRLSFGIQGNPSASIVNEGTISAADYGVAALVAPSVRNSGIITAHLGSVGLSAGNTFTIDPYGDGLIKLAIGDEIATEVYDVATGETVSDLVKNEGTLSADGGTVAMTAATAREAVNSVVNNTGVVEARSVGMQNGMIMLGGSTAATKPAEAPTQTVSVSGTLDASGHDELYSLGVPVEGGDIQITGEAILSHDATIDASGDNGGGTVLVGGDYLGGNIDVQEAVVLGVEIEEVPIDTASLVVLDDSVSISADATEAGDGGKVIVWSDDVTLTAAETTARGGAESGDGGFIETSGKNYLSVLTAADASAANGEVGTWLMDPVDIRIVDGLEQYLTVLPNQFWGQLPVNGSLVDVYADFYVPVDQYDVIRIPCVTEDPGGCTPRETRIDRHSEASLIDSATIEAALNGGTGVFITNTNSVGDDPGTISIEADIIKTAGGDASLGFNAVDDIVISNDVDIVSTSGKLLLSFASANGQIRGSNIGYIDTNGGITLLAAPEGAEVSSAGFVSEVGNPSALQIDIQNYPSAAGSYNLVSSGVGFLDFSYNSNIATFGPDAINLGGNPISLQIIMDHNAVLADGAITDTSESQIVFIFMDPASTMTAAQPGNNVAEIESSGLIVAGSQAGVGGELNVLPVLEVHQDMEPALQCAGITCVPVPPVPPVPGDEVGQVELNPDLTLQELIDLLGEDAGSCKLGENQCSIEITTPLPSEVKTTLPSEVTTTFLETFDGLGIALGSGANTALDSFFEQVEAGEIASESIRYFVEAVFSGSSLTGPQGEERLRLLISALEDPSFLKEFGSELGSHLGVSIFEGAIKAALVSTISTVLEEQTSPEVAAYFEALVPSTEVLEAIAANSTRGVAAAAISIWLDNAMEFTRFGIQLAEAEASGASYEQSLLSMTKYEISFIESLVSRKVSGPAFPVEAQGDDLTEEMERIMLEGLRQMPEDRASIIFAQEYLSGLQDVALEWGRVWNNAAELQLGTGPLQALQ